MGDKVYTGFASYLVEHKITKEFIGDFDYWAKKLFRQWTLFMPYEDFLSQCWEKLMEGLPTFDPEKATIQTFCISRINNECWRIYMKNKSLHAEDDIDDPVVNRDIESRESFDVSYFNEYARHCLSLGINVNLQDLYSDYIEGYESDVVKCFCWWMMKEKLK